MGILDTDEIRNMSNDERRAQIDELNLELSKERGRIAVGGFPENEGRIKDIRRTIARIKTIMNEEQEEQ